MLDTQSILDRAKVLRELERHLRLAVNSEMASENIQRATIDLTLSAIETQTREIRSILTRR